MVSAPRPRTHAIRISNRARNHHRRGRCQLPRGSRHTRDEYGRGPWGVLQVGAVLFLPLVRLKVRIAVHFVQNGEKTIHRGGDLAAGSKPSKIAAKSCRR
jgi:hypothetical protein